MTEPLSTVELVDRLSQLQHHARALEMAISGSASTEPGERKALNRLSEMLVDAIMELHDQVDVQLGAEREANQ
ncbi:MAG: hypothetical protein ACR652_15010 [Methylocystis sp.]|uniref:hypothetical protein n=1 Tax=Methylocystis sp. TaxID=1911079 RepID=UPI003DA355EA